MRSTSDACEIIATMEVHVEAGDYGIEETEVEEPSIPHQIQQREERSTRWQRFARKWLRMERLVVWTMLGVCCGIALGGGLYNTALSNETITLIGYPGEIMIRALQELILPLMVFALMSGVFSLRYSRAGSTGQVSRWAIYYYLLSMVLAIAVGIGIVYAVNPGKSRPFGDASISACAKQNANLVNTTSSSSTQKSTEDALLDIGRQLVPKNIVSAAAEPNYLGIMLFAVAFAFILNTMGERANGVIHGIELCNDVIIKIIKLVIVTTPVGIASLIASTILQACSLGHLLKSLAEYVGTIVGGLSIHSFIVLPAIMFFLSRRNPLRAFKFFIPAVAMGFGTSSSAATMPMAMECAEKYGCRTSIVKFVIPFGTNVSRDGTALYEAVSAIFICQAHGRNLSPGNVVVIAVTAALAAIGSASIPHAGLVTLITVLQAVGLSEYLSDLSLLFAVDWLLSMLRTVVNLWGHGCGAIVVNTWVTNHSKEEDALPVHSQEMEGSVILTRKP